MKRYNYVAFNNKYEVVKGVIDEENKELASERVKGLGYRLVEIKEKNVLFGYTSSSGTLKINDLALFCGQIGMILSAGVNLVTGFEVMMNQTKSKKMKNILAQLNDGVQKGKTLSISMESTEAFPKLLTDMIKTGEVSGSLETVLFNMENFYKREAKIKSKIKNASVYPIFVLAVAVLMLFFFNFFIFGELKEMFADSTELPMITKIVVGFMEFLNKNFIQVIAICVVIFGLFKFLFSIKSVKYSNDRRKLNIPVIGQLTRDIMTSRFSQSMGIFIKSGVPMLEILENIKNIMGNTYIEDKIDKVKIDVVSGGKLAESIEKQGIFESQVTQLMRIGEETGKIDEMLFKVSDIYENRVDNGITKLMALAEPVMILGVGLFVGIIIVAIALPVFNMTQGLK